MNVLKLLDNISQQELNDLAVDLSQYCDYSHEILRKIFDFSVDSEKTEFLADLVKNEEGLVDKYKLIQFCRRNIDEAKSKIIENSQEYLEGKINAYEMILTFIGDPDFDYEKDHYLRNPKKL
jgi:hypothetical protein